MILAEIHSNLTDDQLYAAINRTLLVVTANPRFAVSESQAVELVGRQLVALAQQSKHSDVSAFAKRCLKVFVNQAVLDN
jgi:hypothetical protein